MSNTIPKSQGRNLPDTAVRSVVPNTLGLRFDSLMCQDERLSPIGEPDERVVPNGHGDGAADPTIEVTEEIELEKEECAGRLLEIKKAPKFLENSDWMADAPHADELRRAWNEWRDRIDSDPPD